MDGSSIKLGAAINNSTSNITNNNNNDNDNNFATNNAYSFQPFNYDLQTPKNQKIVSLNFEPDKIEVDQDSGSDDDHTIVNDGSATFNSNNAGDSVEVDSETSVVLTRLSHPPIPKNGLDVFIQAKRCLKFKFNPIGANGLMFVSSSDLNISSKAYESDISLYPVQNISPIFNDNFDSIDCYVDYISQLFKNYETLGNFKYYSNNNFFQSMGCINASNKKISNKVLYDSLDFIIQELEILIEKKIDLKTKNTTKIFDLKDYLNILNCLKSVYFSNDSNLTTNLSIWINKADPDNPALETIKQIFSPSDSIHPVYRPQFFNFLNQLLIRGLFKQVLNLLENLELDKFETNNINIYLLFQNLIGLVNFYQNINADMHLFREFKLNSINIVKELTTTIKNYKINLFNSNNNDEYNNDDLKILENFKTTFTILSGNKNLILKNSLNWFEALNGLMLFNLPNISLFNEYLTLITNNKQQYYHLPNLSNVWESACYSLIQGNFLAVLSSLELLDKDTTPYVATLCEAKGLLHDYTKLDFLNNKKTLLFEDSKNYTSSISQQDIEIEKIHDSLMEEEEDGDETNTISEYLVYNHAMDCLSIRELIPVGVGLLIYLNKPNLKNVLTEFLPNYYCDTFNDLEWLLSICADLKLSALSNQLYKIHSINFLNNGNIFVGLNYLAKSGSLKLLKFYCWNIFTQSLIESDQINNEIINYIVGDDDDTIEKKDIHSQIIKEKKNLNPVLRQCISPYSILFRFFKLKKRGDLKRSLKNLLLLFKFSYLPEDVFPLLLGNLLPFLKSSILNNLNSSLFKLKELVLIINLIDNFYDNKLENKNNKIISEKNGKILKKAENLYKNCIANNKVGEKNWQNELAELKIEIPKNLKELIYFSRLCISEEISRIFLQKDIF
ncbi:Nup85p ASCRUDRAFT_76289 [Ascoidea rubescens DSM 1968]|uniref:Nuclear pore complex protein Nup85 n=1 Tax=Ascoidea rubescens DSM 1968 TaxID=1344418 RepID=A0A1D2VF12_9ASCO|nr:hypothetical protein ASCRUDRAFT_76289 [Ascoidea rubescens DSM 1968]ODV60264.1 hypothetical protein ASCRUDRAFT_76289 [Ascoidea rubescens DSM 1968]